MLSFFRSFFITFLYIFKKKVTLDFPKEKAIRSSSFRGEHALMCDESGEEKCIGCKLCEVICPAQAITIVVAPETDYAQSHLTKVSRRVLKYEIDMTKCIFCGLCEEACPVDAIVETPNIDYAVRNRTDLIYSKDKLIENGKKYART